MQRLQIRGLSVWMLLSRRAQVIVMVTLTIRYDHVGERQQINDPNIQNEERIH